MKADMLLDVIGKVDDAYIVSAQNKLGGIQEDRMRDNGKKTRPGAWQRTVELWHRRYGKVLLTAATVFILLLSSFTVAMAASEEFRNAVFRFFHISSPVTVPPFEEDAASRDAIEIVGSMMVENAVNVEYIRAKGSYGHTVMEGAVCIRDEETGETGAYTIKDGKIIRLKAHTETFEYVWKDITYQISFDWYENNGVVSAGEGDFDLDTSAAWEVGAIEGNAEFVTLTLSYGSQIEHSQYPLLYHLNTHEVVDVLAECEEIKELNIIEAEFSPDLSKILLTCGEVVMWYDEYSRAVYCYDVEAQSWQDMSELCGMNVMDAWFIDEDTVGCLWYDEDFCYTLRTHVLSSEECLERFSDMPDLDWSQDNTGISFNGKRYGLLVTEEGGINVYDFKTGETTPVEGMEYSDYFNAGSFNKSGTKLLVRGTSVGENVWVTQIGILDLEKKTFVSFEREGDGAPREYSIGWFDNDRVGIEANTGEYWYLYLFTVEAPESTSDR